MKRCFSPDPSPPSSPVIGRSKRNQPQEADDNQEVKTSPSQEPSDLEADEEKLIFTKHVREDRNHVDIVSNTDEKKASFQCLNSLLSSPHSATQFLSSGCVLLDRALAGGLRRGEVTEVVGESSAGKTQLCLHFCVEAVTRGERVVYIVTEGAFPSARLDQMVTARRRPEIRDRILIHQVRNVHHLFSVVGSELEDLMRNNKDVSVVIIDSVAGILRYDADVGTGVERGGTIHKLGQMLLDTAIMHRVAVVTVNQVTDTVEERGPGQAHTWGRGQVPSLGGAWAQYPHTRLWVTKTRLVVRSEASAALRGLGGQIRLRTVTVDKSPRLPRSTSHFYVDTEGCRGVNIVD